MYCGLLPWHGLEPISSVSFLFFSLLIPLTNGLDKDLVLLVPNVNYAW